MPFPGFPSDSGQDSGQFNFPRMKPCKLVGNYFINVSFLTVMEMEQSQDMLIASVTLCLEFTYVFHHLKTDAPCSTGGADIA